MFLPERDKYSQSLIELKAMIASLFGGRVAEEMIFGLDHVTTGASDDLKRATDIGRRMVTEFGFSEKLGPLRYNADQEEVFLGHSVSQQKNVSDATAELIDQEVRRFVEEGEATARKILDEHKNELEIIAKGLLEYETLSREEIDALLRGETIDKSEKPSPRQRPPGRRTSVPTTEKGGGENDSGALDPTPEPQPNS